MKWCWIKAGASAASILLSFALLMAGEWDGWAQAQGARKPWIAPPEAKQLKNPFQSKGAKRKAARRGKKTFKTLCVVCHGPKGEGNGPGSVALNPKPANLTSKRVQVQSDGELFWKMSEGRAPMITWKNVLPEKKRWEVVNFLRTLDKEK